MFRAPGRVNLIGEHTDYNLGLRAAGGAGPGHLRRRRAGRGRQAAHLLRRSHRRCANSTPRDLADLAPAHHWTDYPIGVAQRAGARRASPSQPANLLIRSTVPEGSGLSSSAALEVSSALAFLGGRAIDAARTGEALPARRARIRGHALRHHGPVHLRLRPRALGRGDRLPQPGASLVAAARRRRVRGREHHGEARAGRLGLQGPRGGVRRAPWPASSRSFPPSKACAT